MKDRFLIFLDDFLDYLYQIRGYSIQTVTTYDISLKHMIETSHISETDENIDIDITPYRLQVINNNKKTIAKKLSAVRSFVKFLNDQKKFECHFLSE